MMKTRTFQTLVTKVLPCALAIFTLSQCTSDEPKDETPTIAVAAETVSNEGDAPMQSLTIDGVHTVLSSVTDCKTCNYIVPEDATIVDGKELGIKPGQAICLNEAFKYGNLKLINLEGNEENPIIIAYGVKNPGVVSEN
jgi:hypothetical protein